MTLSISMESSDGHVSQQQFLLHPNVVLLINNDAMLVMQSVFVFGRRKLPTIANWSSAYLHKSQRGYYSYSRACRA